MSCILNRLQNRVYFLVSDSRPIIVFATRVVYNSYIIHTQRGIMINPRTQCLTKPPTALRPLPAAPRCAGGLMPQWGGLAVATPPDASQQISSAMRKCQQITPTRKWHCRSRNRPCALPIFHRHWRGLSHRIAVYAKAAIAAVLGHSPASRAIAAHHDAAAGPGFTNCNLDAQRACRPRRHFRFLCRCCACMDIAHSPYRMCGTNLFIGPTQLAVFHVTCTVSLYFRTVVC